MISVVDFEKFRKMNKIFTIFLLLIVSIKGYSQTLPVGIAENVEDAVRRQQLLGLDSTRNSYMIRPLTNVEHYYTSDDANKQSFAARFRKELYRSSTGKVAVYLLPLMWKNQYNTDHPYGINDGSMIPAKGYQTQISGGVYAKLGPLSIQLRPEIVYASNNDYRELNETGSTYSGLYGRIDLPSRFGKDSYSKVFLGQSNVKLTFDPVSIAFSTENLWWGPGIYNSLLMSNNAPGFKHLSLNTSRPINTPVGSFETQIIAGRLENSGYNPESSAYPPKPDDWRYLSGIILTYQPKWIPNLYIGLDRTFNVYRSKMGNKLGDYLPFLGSVLRASFTDTPTGLGTSEDLKERDQYFSVFTRWVLPESGAEVYFQFGRNDHPYNIRDGISEPEHSSAYTAGLRKLIALNQKDTYLQFGFEITQMQGSNTWAIRAQPVWYLHSQVNAGYTNQGQILGSGIGSESNQQSVEVSWIRGLNKLRFRVEHLNNDADFAKQINDVRQYWTDLTFGGKYDWTYNKFIFNSQLVYIRSKNYQYLAESRNNFQIQLGLLYTF
jgi:hypothetical protein